MTAQATSLDPASAETEQALAEQVRAAAADGRRLAIRGGNTKAFYGNPVTADAALDCTGHTGVVAYEPTELAITVRGGTRLAEVEALLAQHGQQLPFEPPHFGAGSEPGASTATIGGAVAAGLSGPRRPYAASVRDAVLGVRLLNGRGQVLEFGGRVMKNVAGYDVSRLMAGSLGVLGVLLEVSLKVIPQAPGTLTLVREETLSGALDLLRRWSRKALPITGSAWVDGRLHVRVDGGEEAMAQTQRIVEGLPLDPADDFWRDLREQRLRFFAGDAPLWRLSLPPATAAEATAGLGAGAPPTDPLVEWGGALRWLRGELLPATVRALAEGAGGHATLFRAGSGEPPADGVFTPQAAVALRLHRNLKRAFDPERILNPGRLYPDL
jgi:glycolate oxidase FAD binding subunit